MFSISKFLFSKFLVSRKLSMVQFFKDLQDPVLRETNAVFNISLIPG